MSSSNYSLNQRLNYILTLIGAIPPTPPGGYVNIDGSQTIGTGIKTFTNMPECGVVPTTNDQLVNKLYVDGIAINATNTAITDTSTNATFYPTFVSSITGDLPQLVDSNLTYNPSTDIMTFGNPPRTSVSASVADELVNFNNFTSPISYNPVLTDNLGNDLNSGNYTVRVGRYIQIGNLVFFQVRIQISGKSGLGVSGNDIRITLPVSASNISNLTQALTIGNISGMTTNIVSAFGQILTGGVGVLNIPIKTSASAGTTPATVGDISTSFQIRLGGFYFS